MSAEPEPQEVAGGGRPPLCFVVMPFGEKPDGQGGKIDFNAVYEQLLAPAIREAKLEPLRADQEVIGGLIHKPMFERLIIADYAVADLTTANANVYYELGVRYAARSGRSSWTSDRSWTSRPASSWICCSPTARPPTGRTSCASSKRCPRCCAARSSCASSTASR